MKKKEKIIYSTFVVLFMYILTISLFSNAVFAEPLKEPFSVEPPLEYTSNTSLIDLIFTKAGAKYVLNPKDLLLGDKTVFNLSEKMELNSILKYVFIPKGLMFEIGKDGVYQIKAIDSTMSGPENSTEQINPVINEKKVIYPLH